MIGSRARRIEDPVLLKGRGRFVADVHRPDELHMRVVRSHEAHGRILRIKTAAARGLRGVAAVWTAADLETRSGRRLEPIDFRLSALAELQPYRQPILADHLVRYVGEPVAAVFAESEYLAEDAAEHVEVHIDPLPVHLDPHLVERWPARGMSSSTSEAAVIDVSYGDVDAAFEHCAHVVDVDVHVGRHSGIPIECRGSAAHVSPETGCLYIDGGAKVPYWNRNAIAMLLERPRATVHIREGHVGGGFGPRGELYPEDVLVALAAERLDRPVRWIEDRAEHMVSCNHSRDQWIRLRAAVDAEGFVGAVDAEIVTDQGAYVRTHGAIVTSLATSMLPGPYEIPNYRVNGRVRMTNKTPAGTYRSPGRYETTFARERLMDRVAEICGISRLEVRRRNLIGKQAMPYRRPMQAMGTDLVYDSGDYQLLMDRMEQHFGLSAIEDTVRARRDAGELSGIGFAWMVEKSGLGPVEGASIVVDEDGRVTVATGASSVGQGVYTVLAQIVADYLTVPLDSISVEHARTDGFPFGRGAFATRQSVTVGSACARAAEALRSNAFTVAAQELECGVHDLELAEGAVRVVGAPAQALSLGRIAGLLAPPTASDYGFPPGLRAEGWFETEQMTYPYGMHVAVVAIDRETGHAAVERYLVGYDVGLALNPTLVEGQIAGGVAQGIGGALLEDFGFDDGGQPTSTTFMDYLIPTIAEIPVIDILVTEDAPSPLNPLGVKGAGEGGINAVAAAVASAIDDALGIPGAITSTPVHPQVIRSLLRNSANHQRWLCPQAPNPTDETTDEEHS